jgi:hypothetical protein
MDGGYIVKLPNDLLMEMIAANTERLNDLIEKGNQFTVEYASSSAPLSKLKLEAKSRGLDSNIILPHDPATPW